jgi:hypothetical protein
MLLGVVTDLGCGVGNEGLYIAASHFELFYEREKQISLTVLLLLKDGGETKNRLMRSVLCRNLDNYLGLADWTQIRYVQAAPLSAFKDPDLHNKTTPSGAPPVRMLPITQIRPSVW